MMILTRDDMKRLCSMNDAIAAAKDALRMSASGKGDSPLRLSLALPRHQAQTLFMPAYAQELDTAGVKIVGVFPNNPTLGKPVVAAQMILFNGETGDMEALLDGTYLTQLRTGALQGAATDTLAKQDAKIAVLIGTGGQAPAQLEAMLSVRELREVRVVGRDMARSEAFVRRMQVDLSPVGTNIVACESSNAAIADADIITAVTTSAEPLFDGRLVAKGAHVNGMGSYQATMQELPANLLQRAAKIFSDTNIGVLAEAGDILIPLQAGALARSALSGELGEVLLGQKKGRQSPHDITLFKSVGFALLDLVTAHKIYQKARLLGIG